MLKTTIIAICAYFGISKSGYYKALKVAERRQDFEAMVLSLIRIILIEHPQYGFRKVRHVLLEDHNVHIGRDHLRRLMRENGLMEPQRIKKVRTSIPNALCPIVDNKIKDLEITYKNQVWVTDITYIQTHEGHLYLSSIMDLWSRCIISYHISEDLKAENSLKCLQKALRGVKNPQGIIHHSDRGCQYSSNLYLACLAENGLEVSFTGPARCYDNANIERFFNTIKHEYHLRIPLKSKSLAIKEIANAIQDYNYNRIHAAINYQKPKIMYDAA